jgi:hypothetical protein
MSTHQIVCCKCVAQLIQVTSNELVQHCCMSIFICIKLISVEQFSSLILSKQTTTFWNVIQIKKIDDILFLLFFLQEFVTFQNPKKKLFQSLQYSECSQQYLSTTRHKSTCDVKYSTTINKVQIKTEHHIQYKMWQTTTNQ